MASTTSHTTHTICQSFRTGGIAHYRKRGSASYIMREVRSVRERERERERGEIQRERERDTERERERRK